MTRAKLRLTHALLIAVQVLVIYPDSLHGGAALPSITGLGDFPGGEFESQATAVSGDGHVVIGVGRTANGQRGFMWTQTTGMQMLGDSTITGMIFGPLAASFDGSVIVGGGTFDGLDGGVIWNNGTISPVWPVDGISGRPSASGVSADGSVIVGSAGGDSYRLVDGVSQVLGYPEGSSGSAVLAVSADGTTVVGEAGTPYPEPCRWRDGKWELFGHFGTGGDGHAFDVSGDGSVAVGGSDTQGNSIPHAFRWENGVLADLGTLPQNGFNAVARGVSDDGSVIVGAYGSEFTGTARAFIWSSECGLRDLTEVMRNDFCTEAPDWVLRFAWGISADGTVVVGSGENPSGNSEAWRIVVPRRSGNINHDVGVNGLDVGPFVIAVLTESDEPADLCACDFDESGRIDFDDIPGMVEALTTFCP